MKNLLFCCVLALILVPGAVATEATATDPPAADPDATTEGQKVEPVAPASACGETAASPWELGEDGFAAWLDRIGAQTLEPDAAERMSVPSCPDVRPCGNGCVEGDGPCFIKPLGSSECCTPEGCLVCEGGTEIFIISCPCFGAGCPRQSQELTCA